MIATLTLNPAVDAACEADRVFPRHKIRTENETHDPGGGGVNVARVLTGMGADALAIVLAGGVTGRFLVELLERDGVPCRAVPIAGITRISMTVQERATGEEYRFVPAGPVIDPAELAAARAVVAETAHDWLVLSGSLPRGVPDAAYGEIAAAEAARGRLVALDCSGPPLRAALGRGLALIKPSLREFEALMGTALPDAADQDAAALRLVRAGAAARVAVSLGAEGALLATADGVLRRPAIPVPVKGAVGAGDSFMAGMVRALAAGASPGEALDWGLAAGAASVMQSGTARPRRSDIEALFARVHCAPGDPG